MKTELKILASAALLALGSSANAAVVDLFSTDQAEIEDTTADATIAPATIEGSSVSTLGSDILGGERDIWINLTTQAAQTPNANVRASVAGGSFSVSVDSGATASAEIQWDGADGSSAVDPTGLGSIDLYALGADGFRAFVNYSDLGFPFAITAYQSATDYTTISLEAHEVSPFTVPGEPGTLIPFDAFQLCGASVVFCSDADGTDLHFLSALVVRFDPLSSFGAFDLTLDNIVTEDVPEPSAMALLGLGLLGTGFAGYRRRKNQA